MQPAAVHSKIRSPRGLARKELAFWCLVAAAWGGVLNWRFSDFMNPDGISYLDIASETRCCGLAALINAHWSPLYPALVAVWESVHRPSAVQEFAYVHILNAVIYAVASACFAYFLYELLQFRSVAGRPIRCECIWIAFSFVLFLYFLNRDVTAFAISPDLLLAAAIFMVSGLCFRILRKQTSWYGYVALGAVAGIGYFAKSVMLPFGLALLCILSLQRPRPPFLVRRVGLAAFTMAMVAAPQIVLVSRRVGRFSIAETGRLNYLWWVDGLPFAGWTGTPGGDKPSHGPRVIEEVPKIIEFSSPVPGTYPLWYDPAYWMEGAKVRIDLRRQIKVVRTSLHFYHLIFSDLRLPFEGLVFLFILSRTRKDPLECRELLFLAWPVACLSMYALLFTEYRYAAPFIILLWVVGYSAIFKNLDKAQRIVLVLLTGVMLFLSLKQTLAKERWVIVPASTNPPRLTAHMITSHQGYSELVAAQTLNSMGVEPGDAISTVGDGFDASYARIARVHIVAEIIDAENFWKMRPEIARAAEAKLAGTGARVLVALNRPYNFQTGLWQTIPGTGYSVLWLHK